MNLIRFLFIDILIDLFYVSFINENISEIYNHLKSLESIFNYLVVSSIINVESFYPSVRNQIL